MGRAAKKETNIERRKEIAKKGKKEREERGKRQNQNQKKKKKEKKKNKQKEQHFARRCITGI